MFSHSRNVVVERGSLTHVGGDFHSFQGNTFQSYSYSNFEGKVRSLFGEIAVGAMHNSQERSDAPRCHKDTRMAVLKDISDWILDRSRESRILWLTAPAGSGKSAILQEIAEMFDESGGLAASFFFSRMADKRNNERHFIPTLAFQLAVSIPSTRPFIEQAIRIDPSLFDKVLLSQMQHLVVEPLVRASLHPDNGSPWPSLLVIDGLDECVGATAQRDILLVLKDALRRLEVSLPRLCVLIASRPEPAICEVFAEGLSATAYHLVLDSHYKPDDDIALYLQSSFSDIYRHRHKYFPSMSSLAQPWPSRDIVSFLVNKSSGQFIFAATVVRFVGADRKVPTAQLQIVMDICKSVDSSCHSSNPFILLDELYAHVLHLSEDLEGVLTYLGAIFHLSGSQTLSCDFLHPLLGLSLEDLSLLFWDLHSIVHVPVSMTDQLHFHHASFSDFLMDKHRSGALHIDELKAHLYLLESCIRNICDALNTSPSSFEDGKYYALQYSLSFWSYHYVCANCIMNDIHPKEWRWSPDDSDINNLAKWWNFFAPACNSWLHHSIGLSLAPHSKAVDSPNNHGYLPNHKGMDKLILQVNAIITQLIPISNGSTVNEVIKHLSVPKHLLKITQEVEKQIVIYTRAGNPMLGKSTKIALTLTPATTCESGDQWDTIVWKICYFEFMTNMQYKINWTGQMGFCRVSELDEGILQPNNLCSVVMPGDATILQTTIEGDQRFSHHMGIPSNELLAVCNMTGVNQHLALCTVDFKKSNSNQFEPVVNLLVKDFFACGPPVMLQAFVVPLHEYHATVL